MIFRSSHQVFTTISTSWSTDLVPRISSQNDVREYVRARLSILVSDLSRLVLVAACGPAVRVTDTAQGRLKLNLDERDDFRNRPSSFVSGANK